MMMRALVVAALCAATGCSPIASRCQDGTLLVAVTLDEASAAADQFAVTPSIDGVPAAPSTVARTTTATSGNLVVQFPHGYPHGHLIAVEVDALAGGNVVGTGSASQLLASSCEVLPLSVSAPGDGDLGGGDDLSAADLSPAPPDMVCVPTSESGDACFDGIDNDCDGDTDCADSDCAAGSQCVPDISAGFTLGITVAQASFCPAMFTSLPTMLNQGLTAASPACTTNLCTCTPGQSCSTGVTSFPATSCSGESDDNSATASCRNFNVNNPTMSVTWDGPVLNNGSSCGAGGTSMHSSSSFATLSRFCQANAVGGGCSPGNVCVPKLSVQTCEIADGTVACDPGYTTTGSWFTGSSDNRNCTCACGSPTAQGTCGSTVGIFTSNDCSGGSLSVGAACTNTSSVYHSIKILGSTNPTCAAATASVTSGMLMGTGPQTVCCRP